jgi:hypothetical protein
MLACVQDMVSRGVLRNPCLGGSAGQQFAVGGRLARIDIARLHEASSESVPAQCTQPLADLNPTNLGSERVNESQAPVTPRAIPRSARGIMMPSNGKMVNIGWPDQGRSHYMTVANWGCFSPPIVLVRWYGVF